MPDSLDLVPIRVFRHQEHRSNTSVTPPNEHPINRLAEFMIRPRGAPK